MSFRAKSLSQQWARWLCAALVGLAVYVVLSRLLNGSMSWNVVRPVNQRIVLPILALFLLFAWEARWDGVRREKKVEGQGQDDGAEEGVSARPAGRFVDATSSSRQNEDVASSDRRDGDVASTTGAVASAEERDVQSSASTSDFDSSSPDDDATGEALFDEARALRHQRIPDFARDADYLALLSRSAAKGHSPALVKLGKYAMRRAAWVEAYYWMKQARRNDMHGLSPILREIRKNWAAAGFPRQSSNVNKIFTAEAGALGRALLRYDSGHEAAKAKEFLKANHPEFL